MATPVERSFCMLLLGLLATGLCAQRESDGVPPGPRALVVSALTAGDVRWAPVLDWFRTERGYEVVSFEGTVSAAKSDLKALMPGVLAFLLRPGEHSPATFGELDQLTCTLDDDPWTDALWGVLEASNPAEALAIAQKAQSTVSMSQWFVTRQIALRGGTSAQGVTGRQGYPQWGHRDPAPDHNLLRQRMEPYQRSVAWIGTAEGAVPETEHYLCWFEKRWPGAEVDRSDPFDAIVADNFVLIPRLPRMQRQSRVGVMIRLRPASAASSEEGSGAEERGDIRVYGPATDAFRGLLGLFPPAQEQTIRKRLLGVGANLGQLLGAIEWCRPSSRAGLANLLITVPDGDLKYLEAHHLLDAVYHSEAALQAAPWRDRVPSEILESYLIPHACAAETRDTWRGYFGGLFQKPARAFKTPLEAAAALREELLIRRGIRVDASGDITQHRGVLDILSGGSGSSLEVCGLFIAACRSAAIPARLLTVVTPDSGQRPCFWVEIWDGSFHALVMDVAVPADVLGRSDSALHRGLHSGEARVFACHWGGPVPFPLPFDPGMLAVRGVELGQDYAARRRITLVLPKDSRELARLVTVRRDGLLEAEVADQDGQAHAVLLPGAYVVEWKGRDGVRQQRSIVIEKGPEAPSVLKLP